MTSRRAQLESKLRSLVASRDELLHMFRQEQQQQHHRGYWTSAAVVGELVDTADNAIEAASVLLGVVNDHSDQLHDQLSTLLDHVSLLITLSSPTYCEHAPLVGFSATAIDTLSNRYCDFVVACLITFCVIMAVCLVGVSSTMSAVCLEVFNIQIFKILLKRLHMYLVFSSRPINCCFYC